MKKIIFFTIAFISTMITMSFEKVDDNAQNTFLEKCWTRSYEEETSKDTLIFRPCKYKEFPPRRFREVLNFKKNNVYSYLVLAPNDAHYMKEAEGKWIYNENKKVIEFYNTNLEVTHKIEVIELTDNLLKVIN